MRYAISEDVVFHAVNSELVLFDLRSGEYLGLDDIGSELWRELADGTDLDTIKSRLATRHRADPAVVGRDIDEVIAELCAAELLHEPD
jgi:hypothetical protein